MHILKVCMSWWRSWHTPSLAESSLWSLLSSLCRYHSRVSVEYDGCIPRWAYPVNVGNSEYSSFSNKEYR